MEREGPGDFSSRWQQTHVYSSCLGSVCVSAAAQVLVVVSVKRVHGRPVLPRTSGNSVVKSLRRGRAHTPAHAAHRYTSIYLCAITYLSTITDSKY